MPLFFRILRHLLPTGRAWRLTVDKALRRFFEGLSGFGDDVRLFLDRVWEDLFPSTTRELSSWEKQHGLAGTGTEEERIAALIAEWQALGGQSLEYIQDVVRAAGFPITLHEHWINGRTPFDLSGTYFSGRSFDFSADHSGAVGVALERTGHSLFVLFDDGADEILNEYPLSTRDNVDSSGPAASSVDVENVGVFPKGLRFSPDGSRYYVLGNASNTLEQHNLASPWNINSETSLTFIDISTVTTDAHGFCLSRDGATLLVVDSGADVVFQFSLGTPWEVTTATPSGVPLDVSSETSGARSAELSGDGLTLFVLDASTLFAYSLTTPNSVAGAAHQGPPLDLSAETTSATNFTFAGSGGQAVGYNNGTKLYVCDSASVAYQYSVADYETRNPHDFLTIPQLGRATCGGVNITCHGDYPDGAPNLDVVCSTEQTSPSDYLVNKDLTNRAPPPIPQDPETWPFFFYVGAEVFGDEVPIPAGRRAEFERLLLKLRPAQQWIGLFIDYQEGFILVDDDDFILTNDDDFILTN